MDGTRVTRIGAADVLTTLQFFENDLGFTRDFVWGEPPVYAGVRNGSTRVYVRHDPALAGAITDQRLGARHLLGSQYRRLIREAQNERCADHRTIE